MTTEDMLRVFTTAELDAWLLARHDEAAVIRRRLDAIAADLRVGYRVLRERLGKA